MILLAAEVALLVVSIWLIFWPARGRPVSSRVFGVCWIGVLAMLIGVTQHVKAVGRRHAFELAAVVDLYPGARLTRVPSAGERSTMEAMAAALHRDSVAARRALDRARSAAAAVKSEPHYWLASTPDSMSTVVAFYRAAAPRAGWQSAGEPAGSPDFTQMDFTRDGRTLSLLIAQEWTETSILYVLGNQHVH